MKSRSAFSITSSFSYWLVSYSAPFIHGALKFSRLLSPSFKPHNKTTKTRTKSAENVSSLCLYRKITSYKQGWEESASFYVVKTRIQSILS